MNTIPPDLSDMSELATLRTAKAALDEGLITEADFNSVKEGFLNAQRIKAGLDAGFIPEEDFAQATAAFFESLGVSSHTAPSGAQQARKPAQASTQQRKVQNGAPLGRPAAGTTATAGATFGRPAAGTTATAGAAYGRAAGSTATTQSTPSPRPKHAAQSGGGGGSGSTWKPNAAPQAVNLSRNSLTKTVVPSSAVSMAGIAVDENAVAEFNLMRVKSKYMWMLFKIDDSGRTVIFCDSGDKSSSYPEFVSRFPQNECRYGVFDYPYETSEGRKLQKLVFFNWAPDTAPVKDKMMASSTKDFVKTQLSGLQVEVQATDTDELHVDEVSKAVGATLTRG